MQQPATKAAIYVRISQDRTGEGAGVIRQEEDCRAKAVAKGWEVVEVYSDNDASAYDPRKPRKRYQAMLAAIRRREVNAVVVWDQDRLDKGGLEAEQFIQLADEYGVALASVGGDYDLSDGNGRMMYRIKGAVARQELEHKSARQKRANRQRAQQGEHFKTHCRPFGYESDGVTIRDSEAEAIRAAFDSILSGGSIREVAKQWNVAGLVTPQAGNEWSGTVASKTLRNARLAGLKSYRGEIMGEAKWPAIVDRDTWTAAQSVLSDPDRRLKFGTVHPSALLLSGVALCSECGSKIQSGGRRKGRTRYRCSAMGGHVYREAQPVDDFIEDLVMARLARPDLIEMFRPAPEAGVDVAELRRGADVIHARKLGFAEAWGAGEMDRAQFVAANARADADLAALEAQMPTTSPASAAVAKLVTGQDVHTGWQALSLEAKRGVVDLLMRVELLPPKTRGIKPYLYEDDGIRRVNPETVMITWRTGV
jgi:DNA invertase Pin-like site-specific DNA recombinase